MKKLILGLILSLALPAIAMPPSTDAMIRGLFADESTFSELLAKEGVKLTSVRVERETLTESLKELCENFSRSGAVLKATLETEEGEKLYYFSTTGDPNKMKLCND